MPVSTSLKKTIQKKLTDITIRVFEELSKTKATDKTKKSLSKSSRKVSRVVHSLLKKAIKEKAKQKKEAIPKKRKPVAPQKRSK